MDDAAAVRLERLTGARVADCRPLGGQHGVLHYRVRLGGSRVGFAKVADSSAGLTNPGFPAEAAGLDWLAAAGAVPVPGVLGHDDQALVTDWIETGQPDRAAAARFGRDLAALHAAGADRFGAPWPGVIAGLPLPNGPLPYGTPPGGAMPGGTASGEPLPGAALPNGSLPGDVAPGEGDAVASGPPGAAWPEWYAAARIAPYVRRARDAGTLGATDVAVIEAAADRAGAVAGPPEPPARLHGDCWSGNVLWSGGRGWLIDPAAHGGHRETDLAMLALFGAPFLDTVLGAYTDTAPLSAGWRGRVPLHQLHPLLVHVCLFGGSYVPATVAAARAVLAL